MRTIFAFAGAAVAEIAGCFSFWLWLRMGKSAWWLVPGTMSLVLFAKECRDMRELRDKVARHYGRQVVQFSLSLPPPDHQ